MSLTINHKVIRWKADHDQKIRLNCSGHRDAGPASYWFPKLRSPDIKSFQRNSRQISGSDHQVWKIPNKGEVLFVCRCDKTKTTTRNRLDSPIDKVPHSKCSGSCVCSSMKSIDNHAR